MKRGMLLCLMIFVFSACTKPEEKENQRNAEDPTLGFCGEQLRVTNGKTCQQLYKTSIALLQLEINGVSSALCTGTLISPKTILTAAHCVDKNLGVSGMLVGFPEDSSASETKKFDVYQVASYIAHPQWNGKPGNPYDIGVVVLKEEVRNRSTVPIISTTAHRAAPGDVIGIYGFGKNEKGEIGVLRYGRMLLEEVLPDPQYKEVLLAASYDKTGQSICNGDSGGPAGMKVDNSYGIVAVNSAGSSAECLEGDYAGFASLQINDNLNFVLDHKAGKISILGDQGLEIY